MLPALISLGTFAFLPSIGIPELVLVLVIVLVIFGPKKLPEIGKAIGQSIKELKKATDVKDENDKETSQEEK